MRATDPDFFKRLCNSQHPEYLWIGCADSRVPVGGGAGSSGRVGCCGSPRAWALLLGARPGRAAVTRRMPLLPPRALLGLLRLTHSAAGVSEQAGSTRPSHPSCHCPPLQANQIMGMAPGEVFVQRNVGNQALHTDMNYMSCLEYSVKALKVGEGGACVRPLA